MNRYWSGGPAGCALQRAAGETGGYVFPAGLATVHIDRDRDRGEYWEPNIWIIHPATGGAPG